MNYKQNTISNRQKLLLFYDIIIDEIMERDKRFKDRESLFEVLSEEMMLNTNNWLNIEEEVERFFEVRQVERSIRKKRAVQNDRS